MSFKNVLFGNAPSARFYEPHVLEWYSKYPRMRENYLMAGMFANDSKEHGDIF